MQIRLIAVDLDGTALRGNGAISRETRRALALARARGATVCVATGRAPQAARHYARILGAHGPLICLDGALVLAGQGCMLDLAVPHDAVDRAVRVAEELGGGWVALTRRGRIHGGPSRRPPQATLREVLRHPGRSLRFVRTVFGEEHRHSVGAPDERVYKLLLWAPRGQARQALDREVRALEVHVPTAPDMSMEVVAPGVSKGRALDVVAQSLGVCAADVVAFGDARNDIEMLAYAGHGVAMGGAPRDVLEVADAQTGTVQQDGLARELLRLLQA